MQAFLDHLYREFHFPLENPILSFSLVLLIILLSPLLLRKINIPGIIGLIISGVVIGPHCLGILEKDAAVDLFSTIGLLYIMFIAGLELDLNEFSKNRNKSLLFGLFTFAVPLCIGYPVCRYFLHYGFEASFLTASMFATHTLVAYPIVSKLGISKNQSVAITVGGTILTDTAVLIILAVVKGSHESSLSPAFWLKLGISLTIFTLVMFLIIPRIAKWFFRKLESEKQSHYIFVLSVVFFSGFMAELAGVEPIIGAFVAGLALNKLIPHSSALMNRIDFIGNSLFIPFFLISVGMLVDVQVIFSGYNAWIIAGALTFIAITGKWIAAFFTQLAFSYSRTQRQLIFGLSSAHAAATLAIILVGFKAGILDKNILNGTIILILVTCVIASLATEKAARKIILEQENDAFDVTTYFDNQEHIMIPITTRENTTKMLDLAILMKEKKSQKPLTLLSIVPNDQEAEENILRAKNKLDVLIQHASASETNVQLLAAIDHNLEGAISRTSREIMANIILTKWPEKTGILDKIIGDRMDGFVTNVEKTSFICDLTGPLIANKRMILICPPHVTKETGFNTWFSKITQLAQELSIPILCFCTERSQANILKVLENNRTTARFAFEAFEDWNDFQSLTGKVRADDLVIVSSARSGSISYMPVLDHIPAKLEKYFPDNSKILIFPKQEETHHFSEGYEEIDLGPLNQGFNKVQRLGREIGSIFKKDGDGKQEK